MASPAAGASGINVGSAGSSRPAAPQKGLTNVINSKQKSTCSKIASIACLVACIALAIIGVAAIVGLALYARGSSFPLATIMAGLAARIHPVGAWATSIIVFLAGSAGIALRITKTEEAAAV